MSGLRVNGRPLRSRIGATVLSPALVALFLVAMSGTASAASTCTYNGTDAVAVAIDPSDGVSLAIGKTAVGNIDFAIGSGAYARCGTATSANTTTVTVTGSSADETFTLDQTGSAIFPSGTITAITVDMGDGTGDALVITGTSGADKIRFGADGVNLDAGASTSIDLTLAGTEAVTVNAGEGDDTVNGAGGRGAGAAFTTPLELYGGDGNDNLSGGDGKDVLSGGDGGDVLSGGGGADDITGGAGKDVLHGVDGRDTIKGRAGADDIYGGEGNDSLYGGRGDDHIYGGPGIDSCNAGPGADAVTGCEKH